MSLTGRRLLDSTDPCRIFEANGLSPDPWQAEVLRARPHRALLAWGRQSGKSTLISARALHEALYRAPALIVVSSFAERQSKELLNKVLALYRPFAAEFPLVVDAKNEKGFACGSRIVALPGKADSARSFSGATLVILDEAGFTTDELRTTIDALLATRNGDLFALSTPPHVAAGWWWSTWTQNGTFSAEEASQIVDDGWMRSFLPSTRCPRISAKFLDETRADFVRRGQLEDFEREYLCKFPELKRSGNRLPISPEQFDAIFATAEGDAEMPRARE